MTLKWNKKLCIEHLTTLRDPFETLGILPAVPGTIPGMPGGNGQSSMTEADNVMASLLEQAKEKK